MHASTQKPTEVAQSISIRTLSKTNPGPTASEKVVRHFMAGARVLISATRSLIPANQAK